jgi:hypothetical protein
MLVFNIAIGRQRSREGSVGKKAVADTRKPNSVPFDSRPLTQTLAQGDDHSSSPVIADGIEQPTRRHLPRFSYGEIAIAWRKRSDGPSDGASLFGLAPCGVLPATRVTTGAVRSYRTFSPLPLDSAQSAESKGGMFSVPLSFGLPRPGVTRRTALRSSDFPPFDSALRASLRADSQPCMRQACRERGPEGRVERRSSAYLRRLLQ